jgi:hypothetical protein
MVQSARRSPSVVVVVVAVLPLIGVVAGAVLPAAADRC